MKYVIIKDTREKMGWDFQPSNFCESVENTALETGDYTIKGMENVLCIERKRNTSEIFGNLFEKDGRFVRELERMRTFKYAFLVLEFTMDDVVKFPHGSGIPYNRQKYMQVTGPLLLKKLLELQLQFPFVQFVYAGKAGKEFAMSLMKRVAEREEECQKTTI